MMLEREVAIIPTVCSELNPYCEEIADLRYSDSQMFSVGGTRSEKNAFQNAFLISERTQERFGIKQKNVKTERTMNFLNERGSDIRSKVTFNLGQNS